VIEKTDELMHVFLVHYTCGMVWIAVCANTVQLCAQLVMENPLHNGILVPLSHKTELDYHAVSAY